MVESSSAVAAQEVPVSVNRQLRTPERVDLAREWFKWWRGVLGADEDPRFRQTWERACRLAQRAAIERTSSWAGLTPLLQDMLGYLNDLAIEAEAQDLEKRCPHCGMSLDVPTDAQ